MIKFYNHEEIKIISKEKKDYNEEIFNLDVPSLYGMQYFQEVDAAIQSFINKIEKNQPTLIKIVGNFDLLREANEEDKLDFIQTIVSFFVDALLIKDKMNERKEAMLRTKVLKDANLIEIKRIQIRNFGLKINSLNIQVFNKEDEKPIFEVF